MKQKLLITGFMAFMLLVGLRGWGQILTFEFSSLAGNEINATSNLNDPNLTSSTISRGSGLTAAANSGRFNATSWALESIGNAVTGDKYMEFTMTPNSGYQFSVSSIVVQWQRSGTGNTAISLRSSVDNYTTDLDAIKSVVDNTSTQSFTWTFEQSNSASAVTYRFYSYAEATGGTGGPGDGSGNDIIIYGETSTTGTSSPAISVSPATLSDFTYVIGNGPSDEQSFTVSGSNLTNDISILPPTNYEISTGTGESFVATTPIPLTQSGGNVASTTIYVRLKAGLSVNSYDSEAITASSTGADNKTVTCSGSVTAPPSPTITVTPTTLTGFTYVVGSGPSAELSFTVSGANLTDNIEINAPTNYEISTGTGGSFIATDPIPLSQTGGAVASTIIYVRLKEGLALGQYSQDILATSTDAANKTVTCTGSVTKPVFSQWNFTTITDLNSPEPSLGAGTASIIGSLSGPNSATGMNTVTGCGTQSGGGFSWAFSANPGTTNESSGVQFSSSTAGYQNISFQWEQRWSGSSTNTVRLQYSLNGTTWVNFEMTDLNSTYCLGTLNNGRFETNTTGDQYRRITVDLSSLTEANNNLNFGIRLLAAHYQSTGEFRQVTSPTTVATGGTWRFDNVTFIGEAIVGAVASKLAVTDVNSGNTPVAGEVFTVTVQAQDVDGIPTNVTTNTGITLSKATGTGALGETLTGTINNGENSVTFNNVTYSVAETGVSITASATSGMTLTAGTSSLFSVSAPILEPANHVTSFALAANSTTQITASWNDALPVAEGYLIKGSTVGFADIVAPADGIAETNGLLIKNIGPDIETAIFSGLSKNTTYYFKVFPYNGSGSAINYKVNGSVPQASATTLTTSELEPGDIAFVAYATDAPDRFAFVVLVDMLAETEINFTDNAWTGTALNTNEQTGTYKAPAGGIAKGTLITVTDPDAGTTSTVTGGGTFTGRLNGLAAAGDQILAYQGTSVSPTFIAALASNTWLSTGAVNNNTSYLPTVLTNNQNAIDFPTEMDNGYYNGSTAGTRQELLVLINDPVNWERSIENQIWPDWTFTILTSSNLHPIVNNIVQTPATSVAPSNTVSVSANVYDPDGTIATVTLNWGTASGVLTNQIPMQLPGKAIYTTQASIPAQVEGTTVFYKITAVDNFGGTTNSAQFSYAVYEPPTLLTITGFPSGGVVNTNLSSFTVEARRSDNTIAPNYTGLITLSISSGPGGISGTFAKAAIAGVATFNDIKFDLVGTYIISASASGLTSATSSSILITNAPQLTELILPQYIQGINGTNINRLPFAFRIKLDNLLPNTTYRYINQLVINTDEPTNNGAGNVIFINADQTFTRSTSPTFSSEGAYGTLITDANGSFTGWFMNETTANPRFTPGNEVYIRIRVNDGNNGTIPQKYFTSTNLVKVINFGTNAEANLGTAIRAESNASPKNFIFLYDNTAGTGRPLYGSSIETTGIDYTVSTWSAFYRSNVAGNDGAWGGIIPNMNANGVKLIQERKLDDGAVASTHSSESGTWGAYNTVNPTGGTSEVIVIDLTQSPTVTVNPIALTGFNYIEGQGPSTTQSFIVSGTNLNSSITLTPSANYEISQTNNPGFVPSVSVTLNPSAGVLDNTTIFVRLKTGLTAGNYNGETISISSSGADNKIVTCSGTVSPPASPSITANPQTLGEFTYNVGQGPSAEKSFIISGSSLDANITLTPPANFEISLSSGAGFIATNPVTINQTGGAVNNTTVHVRLKAGLPEGTYNNESIIASSLNAANKTVVCSGSVVVPATKLAFVNVPLSGLAGNNIAAFTVQAQANDNSVSTTYTGNITLTIASGPGNLSGTHTKAAVAGIATFNDIAFDQPGTYTLYANATSLTQALSSEIIITDLPQLTEVILPMYIQGVNGTNNNRLPFAYRLELSNLLPNSTYRYMNQIVVPTDEPTYGGAGNVIYVNADNTFSRSTSQSLGTPGNYGEFTTDESGSYTGWFMNEPTGNARFTPGNDIYIRFRLNNGNNGTSVVTYLTTVTPVKVINFGTTVIENQGTAIRAVSNAAPKNFVFLYDNINGTGRPLYGTSVETTDIDFTATTWSTFYKNDVAGEYGAWGGIVPNNNNNGVRLIEERNLSDGNIASTRTSATGIWGLANTVNPTGGTSNVIVIDLQSGPNISINPKTLNGFTYIEGQGPSDTQFFTLNGTNLTDNVYVTPVANFEVSLTNAPNFTPSALIALNHVNGILNSTTIYTRLKSGLNVGLYNDELIYVVSVGVPDQTVVLNGTVTGGTSVPISHATMFAATAASSNQINTTWVDAVPASAAYLIKGSSTGFADIIPPVNGVEESNGLLVRNVTSGIQNHPFTALNSQSTYYFKIFPYNGSGINIKYKTDGQIPQASATTPQGPQMTEDILPLTMQGLNGTNNSRIPYAFRLTISGLLPNATYKYINQAVNAADGPTTAGAGNGIYVLADGSFLRSSASSFTNSAQHAEFLTNANGSYSGWFMLEPTGNERFTPGDEVFMRLRLNNGAGGTTAVHYFTTQGITILGFGESSNAQSGTGLRATSAFSPKNFVFFYNDNRSSRPIAGTSIETTGIDFASQTTYPSFYRTQISGVDGAFGTIVPNVNVAGIRTIEERSLITGGVVSVKSSADGQWGQTQTANPAGGLTEIIVLELDPTPTVAVTPNTLQGFAYVESFGPSTEQLFSVSGTNLLSQMVITAPASFEISLTGGSQFEAQNTVQVPSVNGIVNATQIFVRMKSGLAAGIYTESVVVSSLDAVAKNVAVSGTVQAPATEPLSHVSGFTVSVSSMTQLTASWIDAVPSSSYLIKGSAIGFASISYPADGVPEADALLVKNVTQGTQNVAFTGLDPETTYFFKIFPYNGLGNQINYKKDGVVPQGSSTTLGEVALTTDLLPQYMQGINGTNNSRLPFAFRATITNLKPNSVYRFINQAVSSDDGLTASGAGNPIFSSQNIFYRSTNPGFSTVGQYGSFTSDATGRYTGWFMLEPTGNVRYTPGNTVFMRIRLNDGSGGVTASHYLTTEGVTVLNFGQTADEHSGTGIRAISDAGPKNFAFIYDNVNGFGRPLYGTSIETTGVDYATNTSYPTFYREEVAESNGSWGGIIPNLNPSGVRRVEERSLTTGNIIHTKTSDDGFWGQTNTSNPSGGLSTIIVLDLTEGVQLEKIAGQLKFFNDGETLIPSPDGNQVFYVQLFENGIPVRPRQMVKYNAVANLSSYFEFNNIEAGRSYTLRVWEQNQNNLLGETWLWNNWGGVSSIDALIALYMGIQSPEVDVFPWIKDVVSNSYTPYFNAVADVNSSGDITSADALTILYRTMGLSETSPFPQNTPDFRLAGVKVNDHETMTYPQAPTNLFTPNGIYNAESAATSVFFEGEVPQVETGLNIFNVFFVATGDMNASYNPVASKQTSVALSSTQTIISKVGEEVKLPVILEQEINVAALNMGIRYDNQLIRITAVEGFDLFNIDHEKGIVRIAWMDQNGRKIEKDNVLLSLKAQVLTEITNETHLNLDIETEFASPDAKIIDDVKLRSTALTTASELVQSLTLEHTSYPNPFKEMAVISYLLPEAGQVKVTVFNRLGQEVAAFNNSYTEAGQHQLDLHNSDLNGSGIYFYHISLEGSARNWSAKGTLVFTK